MEVPSPRYDSALGIQKVAGGLAVITSLISVILVSEWMTNSDTSELFLGGVDLHKKLFQYHPILMVAGMIFIGATSIVSYRILPIPKKYTKSLHGTLKTLSVVCLSLGLAAVFTGNNDKSHNEVNAYFANLTTVHSYIGLGAVIVYCQNFLLGAYTFYFASPDTRGCYLPWHQFLGFTAFTMATMAALSGITELAGEMGCGYVPPDDKPDTNPASNYHLLPKGCQVSNGAGIMILFTFFLVAFSLAELGGSKKSKKDRFDVEAPLTGDNRW